MKKTTLTVTLTILMAVFVFVGCHSKQDKLDDAQENLQDAKQDLAEANGDSTVSVTVNPEWKGYRADIEKRIDMNNDRIAQLREKIAKPGMPNLDKTRAKRIDDLQARNAQLRADLAAYESSTTRSDWAEFKAKVNKEIDDVSKEIDDMSADSKK